MTDDETHVPMPGEEKVAWAYGAAVVVTSGAYFAWLLAQLADRDPHQISWAVPMAIAIAACVVLVIVVTILASIGAAVSTTLRGRFQEIDFSSDERDQAIKQLGDRRTLSALSIAVVGALALAMFDVAPFWIGNFLFLVCSVGSLVEVATKIRAYRRGL